MKGKFKLFYCEYIYGCGIRAYTDIDTATKEEALENGKRNLRLVRLATEEEIEHVRGMGGYLPDLYRLNKDDEPQDEPQNKMKDKALGTAGELIQYLQTFPKESKVILQSDPEGNGYSPLADVWSGLYVPETKGSGEVYEIPDGPIENGELAIIFAPIS